MKFKKCLSLLLCVPLLCGCLGLSGCGSKGETIDGATIITFGDSLTAFGTWPRMVAEETNMYLFNAAVGGINTNEALERIERYVTNRDADFVTLCFGMNDLLMQARNAPQVMPSKFKENLQTMCDMIIDMGATPILMTPSYLNEDLFYTSQAQSESNYSSVGGPLAWLDTYCDEIRDLAEEKGYALVDVRAACDDYTVTEFLSSDGIHLGDLGNEVYTELLVRFFNDNYENDPKAEKITTLFPYKSSPAEPAVTDIISYDPADWDTPNEGDMTFEQDEDGALLICNTTGQWPDAHYAAEISVLVPLEGTELVYDFSTANVNTSMLLFFDGATPFAATEGRYVSINSSLGVNTDSVGDILKNQDCKGSVKLTELGIPSDAIDENGNVLISGMKIYAAGMMGQPVTIRQLAVSTQGAPNE